MSACLPEAVAIGESLAWYGQEPIHLPESLATPDWVQDHSGSESGRFDSEPGPIGWGLDRFGSEQDPTG